MQPDEAKSLLAYSPMLHSRLFRQTARFRDAHFQPTRESLIDHDPSTSAPWLDGNPKLDRPLIVQFCSNDTQDLLEAARYVAPYCDAVDLNLGCPQGIARSGRYGAFLQEDWNLISRLINKLHEELPVPVTAKIRILESKERTLEYAKMILSAGASILTVHGRRREQKGHNMGIADWSCIRYLRDHLPPDTVIFANGNILDRTDLQPCLDATGADGVMSAEGNLSDPTIFSLPPPIREGEREYWRGGEGQEGYRIDAVIRRYFDIVYRYILERDPPSRRPLFLPSDPPEVANTDPAMERKQNSSEPPEKSQSSNRKSTLASPNLKAMQGHLFQLLRPILSTHRDIRGALAKCRLGDMDAFERVLTMIEASVKEALLDTQNDQQLGLNGAHPPAKVEHDEPNQNSNAGGNSGPTIVTSKYKKPWWVCQPYIRPLPEQALESGALTSSKKHKAKLGKESEGSYTANGGDIPCLRDKATDASHPELPNGALVCG